MFMKHKQPAAVLKLTTHHAALLSRMSVIQQGDQSKELYLLSWIKIPSYYNHSCNILILQFIAESRVRGGKKTYFSFILSKIFPVYLYFLVGWIAGRCKALFIP